MNCFYCHNRPLLDNGGPVVVMDDLRSFLKKRVGLLDGVVISGGEPTLQADLYDFFKELKALGYATKLDTNGSNPDTVMRLVNDGLLNYVAVDVKAPKDAYSWVCSDANGYENARKTILLLHESGIDFEARTTLYPGLEPDELYEMLLSFPKLKRYRLNFFRSPEEHDPSHRLLLRRATMTKDALEALWPRLKEIQPGICL